MTPIVPGIHHVTAVAGDPQANLEFYAGLLGLRLVKRTVNFDDPGTYHFYYGDPSGSPGTLLSFFAWGPAGSGRARHGAGEVSEVAFGVPARSLAWWSARLARRGVPPANAAPRHGGPALGFSDPDGLALALVADPALEGVPGWERGPVPAAHAVRGLHAIALVETNPARTAAFLTSALGLRLVGEGSGRIRLGADGAALGTRVDLTAAPAGARRATVGAGSVHHVAWRAADDRAQAELREALLARGGHVTPVLDRRYFRSIYFREPGSVLFEIATDGPGFTVDEDAAALGSGLRLPPWLEPERGRIERVLPPVRVPEGAPR